MMKRFLVVLAMVPVLASANELSVGTFQLSGNSNFGLEKGTLDFGGGDEVDTSAFGLDVSGLYYVTPMLGVGLGVSYETASLEFPLGGKISSTTTVIGPQIGLDYPLAEQVSLFVDLGLGYATSNEEETGSPDFEMSGLGVNAGVGLKYFIAKSVSFDTGLELTRVKLTGDNDAERTESNFGLNVGLSVYFGGP